MAQASGFLIPKGLYLRTAETNLQGRQDDAV